jgi:hypothetical protein
MVDVRQTRRKRSPAAALRPLSTERCPWGASHEGGEAFPVVSTGSWGEKGLLARPCRGTEV